MTIITVMMTILAWNSTTITILNNTSHIIFYYIR